MLPPPPPPCILSSAWAFTGRMPQGELFQGANRLVTAGTSNIAQLNICLIYLIYGTEMFFDIICYHTPIVCLINKFYVELKAQNRDEKRNKHAGFLCAYVGGLDWEFFFFFFEILGAFPFLEQF